VLQGSLTNTLPLNTKSLRSSIVPQQGGITSVLGLPAEDGDQLFTYAGGYSAYQYDGLGDAWDPTEPVLNVGQSFFYIKNGTSVSSSWVRNFTVQ